MRHFFIILLASFFILGCRETTEGEKVEMDKVEVIDDQSPKDTVEPVGVYMGTIPCDDCPGIQTELSLTEDGKYILRTKRIGTNDPFMEQLGNYQVSDVGNLVILDGIGDGSGSNTYFYQENMLIQLDKDGNKLNTDLEGDYILVKQEM